jgi:methionine-rich copper-binding protein CopC
MKKTSISLLTVLFICILVCILPVAGDDTTPPTTVSTYPADGDVHIPIDISAITITFNEPIQWDPNTMSVHLYDWGWNDVPIGDISEDVNTLIIHAPASPTPWLENWVWSPYFTGIYDVQVYGVKDLAGNVMEPSSSSIHFYTVPYDTTPPSVISTSPTAGASNIAQDVIITAVMSKEINKCTGSVEMVDSNNYPVALLGSRCYDTTDYTTLVITPAASLNAGESYTVTIKEIEDTYKYIMETPYSWSFTVVGPPNVISTYPANGASNVPANVIITATMDKTINLCIGTVEMVDSNNNPVALLYPDHYFHSADYIHLEIKPVAPLVLGETYTVTIQGLDHQGIVMETPYSWSFTVKTSAETAQDLSTQVDGLGLPKGIEKGLLAKLDTAGKKITQEQYTPARNTLNAFINEINAQRRKALTMAQADELIATAQRIINSIPGK